MKGSPDRHCKSTFWYLILLPCISQWSYAVQSVNCKWLDEIRFDYETVARIKASSAFWITWLHWISNVRLDIVNIILDMRLFKLFSPLLATKTERSGNKSFNIGFCCNIGKNRFTILLTLGPLGLNLMAKITEFSIRSHILRSCPILWNHTQKSGYNITQLTELLICKVKIKIVKET